MATKAKEHSGPVGFGSDGVHYALDKDGHLDMSKPLRWVDGDKYRAAEEDDQLHNDVHHQQELELDPGGEG